MEQIRLEELLIRLKIIALWLFVLLNIIFRDIHQMTLKSHLEMLLTGYYNGMEITDTIMLVGAFIVNVPISMLLVTLLAKPKTARKLNYVAVVLLTLSFLPALPTDMDDVFHLTVELIALAAIVFTAGKWKKAPLLPVKERAGNPESN